MNFLSKIIFEMLFYWFLIFENVRLLVRVCVKEKFVGIRVIIGLLDLVNIRYDS